LHTATAEFSGFSFFELKLKFLEFDKDLIRSIKGFNQLSLDSFFA